MNQRTARQEVVALPQSPNGRTSWSRAIHFPVMLYLVLFIVVHVALVLSRWVPATPSIH